MAGEGEMRSSLRVYLSGQSHPSSRMSPAVLHLLCCIEMGSSTEELEKSLNLALEEGYRLIDTAFNYKNEHVIGKVLSEWFTSGKLKREDIFITTKLPPEGNNPKVVREHMQKSLKDLQLEYVDLYLIHHPVGMLPANGNGDTPRMDMDTDHVALWKEMEKLVDAGMTKYIGISKFSIKQIERVMINARIQPANLQTEMHLYNQCKDMQSFCKKKGMTLTSFSTLGSGAVPISYKVCKDSPLEDPVVAQIAQAHGKTPGQILIRHMLQCGVAVIPKSFNPDRLRQNREVFDFQLTASEMTELNSLDRGENGGMFVFEKLKSHPEYPYPK